MSDDEHMDGTAVILPAYAAPVLDIVAEPPFRHEDTLLHALLLDGDLDALQTSIDTLFAPLGLDLRVETGAVLVTALYVNKAYGTRGHYPRLGWARETDVALWALARAEQGALYWVPLYMFVDSGVALVAGREIYGFPKQLAAIVRTDPADDDALGVTVTTEHFPPASQPVPAQTAALVKIVRAGGGTAGTALSTADFAIRFADAAGLGSAIGDIVAPYGSPNGIKVPMLFLKQFRDAVDPTRAAYRAAVSVESVSLGPVSIGMSVTPWNVDLTPSASHPVARDLGLSASNRALAAFTIRQDFEVGAGKLLVR